MWPMMTHARVCIYRRHDISVAKKGEVLAVEADFAKAKWKWWSFWEVKHGDVETHTLSLYVCLRVGGTSRCFHSIDDFLFVNDFGRNRLHGSWVSKGKLNLCQLFHCEIWNTLPRRWGTSTQDVWRENAPCRCIKSGASANVCAWKPWAP